MRFLNTAAAAWGTRLCKTVVFLGLTSVVCWAASLPRTFNVLSHLATASALFAFVSAVLAVVFVVIQARPAN